MYAVRAAVLSTFCLCTLCLADDYSVTYDPPDGVAAVNKQVRLTLHGPTTQPIGFRVRSNGTKVLIEGELSDSKTIDVSDSKPGTVLVEFISKNGQKNEVIRTSGAAIEPFSLKPAAEPPADFDAFWASQIRSLRSVPPNAKLIAAPSGRAGVDYFEVTLDNVDGRHVKAQLARPTGTTKLPAMVVYQWAGVYGLDKGWVTGPAADGWLVLNVSAHDLPIAESADFYKQQNDGPLKNYVAIGATDRQASYFRTMLLGDYQAIEYLVSRPDWDGKTLVVRGASQGGLQAIAMAGLHAKVTAMAAVVPAGCDTLGQQAGRQPGWPYWFAHGEPGDRQKVMTTSRYFDASNFARWVTCPSLIGVGLRDTTSPPAGVFGMYNVLAGQKEIVINPDAVHQSPQPTFDTRQAKWLAEQRQRSAVSPTTGPAARP